MCADILPVLYLFRNVKITRDYSVVHDLTPAQWHAYLQNLNSEQSGDPSPPVQVYSAAVNYYRIPDIIRIEGKYDEIRKATYGELLYVEGPDIHRYFFWVDSVRLVKASSTDTAPRQDVVDLEIKNDIWSNKFTDCKLYDSFVVRRHEDRWWKDLSNVYHPRYFPNAEDPVGGAYSPIHTEDISGTKSLKRGTESSDARDFSFMFFVISVMDNDGKGKFLIVPMAYDIANARTEEVRDAVGDVAYSSTLRTPYFNEIINGTLFDAAVVDASYVQSIAVLPDLKPIMSNIGQMHNTTSPYGWFIGVDVSAVYTNYSIQKKNNPDTVTYPFYWFETTNNYNSFPSLILGDTVTATDVKEPALTNPSTEIVYTDSHEPMLFRAPAMIRKIVTGLGGTVVDIPDIEAFNKEFTTQNMIEFVGTSTMVYGGTDIKAANGIGNIGSVIAATLPIYESAWKNYEAIQKAGDDIAYNAQQVSTIVGTVTGAIGGLAGGAVSGAMSTGNPVGAVAGAGLGIGGSVAGGITKYWSNSENLKAKRETIKNSPCVIVNTGSGLAASLGGMVDLCLMVLRLDDVSYNKLRTQYYYYGYNVNMVIPGTISTSTRIYFDYIETRGANVRGDVNAEEAQEIANIFDRGVRIYHGYSGYQLIGGGMSRANTESSLMP